MLLIYNQSIQLDKGNFCRHGVETVLDERILEEFNQEWFVFRSHLANGRIICDAGLFLFDPAYKSPGVLPFIRKNTVVKGVHSVMPDVSKEVLQFGPSGQIQIFIDCILTGWNGQP